MRLLIALATFFLSFNVPAEEVIRIEVGGDYSKYSNADLRRRVHDLERAVAQLQQRVFSLEVTKPSTPPPPVADSWICTVKAMGDTYTGTGGSKAVATHKAIEACKAARGGDGFFCKEAKCEQ